MSISGASRSKPLSHKATNTHTYPCILYLLHTLTFIRAHTHILWLILDKCKKKKTFLAGCHTVGKVSMSAKERGHGFQRSRTFPLLGSNQNLELGSTFPMCPFLLSPACSHLELKLLALYCVSNVDTPLYGFFFLSKLWERRGRKRTLLFHALVHSLWMSTMCSAGLGLKQGAGDSIQLPHKGGRNPVHLSQHLVPPKVFIHWQLETGIKAGHP